MLKVVVDATPIRHNPSGIGLYAFNLINSLNDLQTQEDFQLGISYQPSLKNWMFGNLVAPEKFKDYSNLYLLPIPVTISNLLAKYRNPIIPYLERFLGQPDLVHGTDNVVYPCQNSLKVMTIFDLTFIKYPAYASSIVRTYSSRVKQCLKWTDLVITISQSSKNDIVEYLGIDPNCIYVTYLASRYGAGYLSSEFTQKLQYTIDYDFTKPYILFVSTIEPRKNINNLILAFNLLKNHAQIEHQLILIGKKGWNYQPIFAAIESSPWKQDIHHLDYLSDELVALFYSKADAFVYPSHYEGFGLPVLEAMTLGTPVITSNTSSLPEVVGDAALMVDPNSPCQIAEAILRVIGDSSLRDELIQKGKERGKLFSWEKTARETLKAYKLVMAPAKAPLKS